MSQRHTSQGCASTRDPEPGLGRSPGVSLPSLYLFFRSNWCGGMCIYSCRHTSVLPTRPQATDWDVRVPSLWSRPKRVVGMVIRTNRPEAGLGGCGKLPGAGKEFSVSRMPPPLQITHSSILAWKIPWTAESGWLQFMRLQRVGRI